MLIKKSYLSSYCPIQCPLECNQTLYTTSMSSYDLIGNLYADFINSKPNLLNDFNLKPVDVETARRNFVSVSLYYNSLSYTLSEEKPSLDIVALLANIGGTMGLFLGISFLHVCELVDVFLELGFMFVEKRRKKVEPTQTNVLSFQSQNALSDINTKHKKIFFFFKNSFKSNITKLN